jgi:hypothetical protein
MLCGNSDVQYGVKALIQSFTSVRFLEGPILSDYNSIYYCLISAAVDNLWQCPGGRDYLKNSDPIYSFFYPR